MKKQILAEAECPYNLETGSVLRVHLFTRSAIEHIQLLAMHVTNRFGFEWLQRHLGDTYNLHLVEFDDKRAIHIDATFLPLVTPNRRKC